MIRGILGYADYSGLGRMNRTLIEQIGGEWVHLVCPNGGKTEEWDPKETGAEVMLSPDWTPPDDMVREFVEKCDVVVCVETDYRTGLAGVAEEVGRTSVLIPMYEWLGVPMRCPNFDRYICTSRITYRETKVEDSRKRYLPWPVEAFVFYSGSPAWPPKTFLHCAGHGGMNGRKGTVTAVKGFLAADVDAKLIIRSQVPLEKIDPELPALCEHDRIQVQVHNFTSHELYQHADAYLYPACLDGQAMVPQEAIAAGLTVFVTDAAPMNEFQLHPEQYLRCINEPRPIAGKMVLWSKCIIADLARAIEWAVNCGWSPQPLQGGIYTWHDLNTLWQGALR